MHQIPIRKISALNTRKSAGGNFSIRSLKQLLNGKDLHHDLHKHDFFLILAIQKGKGVHEIDFTKHIVRHNTIFIVRPGQVHRLHLKSGTEGFLLQFDPAFYSPKEIPAHLRLKKAAAKNYCRLKPESFSSLHAALINIYNEFTSAQEFYMEAIKANLDLFFINYVRQSDHPKKLLPIEEKYPRQRLDELTVLLETNISAVKKVSEYSRLLNLSSYQLNAIAKAAVGKTVSQLIDEQILLEAKRHLLATPMQVKEIADRLGYKDVSYFIRFFKKRTGHSPEAFRRHFK